MILKQKTGFVLQYGALELPFAIENRQRKSVSIVVHPNRSLQVIAPLGADLETVLSRVDGKAGWIARQWRFFAQKSEPTLEKGFFAGETHWYLGCPYRLKIERVAQVEGQSVRLEGRFFWIQLKARQDAATEVPGETPGESANEPTATAREGAHIARLLDAWYRAQARQVFALWLDKCLAGARSLEMSAPPMIEVRRMQKRWGSCTASGKILLGLDLVKAPVDCIEYVIFHELCHLQIPHHGPEFYRLLTRFLPDWKARKARLEEWGERI